MLKIPKSVLDISLLGDFNSPSLSPSGCILIDNISHNINIIIILGVVYMLTYKHNEYEYIYDDENNNDNLIEIRKDGVIVDNIQSPVSNLEDAKNLQNTVMVLGLK